MPHGRRNPAGTTIEAAAPVWSGHDRLRKPPREENESTARRTADPSRGTGRYPGKRTLGAATWPCAGAVRDPNSVGSRPCAGRLSFVGRGGQAGPALKVRPGRGMPAGRSPPSQTPRAGCRRGSPTGTSRHGQQPLTYQASSVLPLETMASGPEPDRVYPSRRVRHRFLMSAQSRSLDR